MLEYHARESFACFDLSIPMCATRFLNGDTHLLPWPWIEIFKLHKFRLASNLFVGNHVGLHGSSLTVATQNMFVPYSCTTSQCKKYDNYNSTFSNSMSHESNGQSKNTNFHNHNFCNAKISISSACHRRSISMLSGYFRMI